MHSAWRLLLISLNRPVHRRITAGSLLLPIKTQPGGVCVCGTSEQTINFDLLYTLLGRWWSLIDFRICGVLLFGFLDRVRWFYISLGRCWNPFDFKQQGRQGRCMAVANEAPCRWLGYHGWSPWRTCEQSYVLGMAGGQAKNHFTDIFYFMHGCRNLFIWSCNFSLSFSQNEHETLLVTL